MVTKEVRPKLYTLRLSEEEDERAHRVADHLGVPISSLLRMLLLEKERELGLGPKRKR